MYFNLPSLKIVFNTDWSKQQATDKCCSYCEIPAMLKELFQATKGISFIGKK